MYLVIFKESSIKEIQSGSQYAFVDAFHLTRKIEIRCKEQGVKVPVDFDLLDEHFTELYHGTFTFGSGYSTDIFDHIYKKMNLMTLDAEQEEQKIELLEVLRGEIDIEDTPFEESEYIEEHPQTIDKPTVERNSQQSNYQNENPTQPPKGFKGNKKYLKVLAGVGSIALIGMSVFFSIKMFTTNPDSKANAGSENYLMKGLQQAAIQQYGEASIQFDKVEYSQTDKDSQKAILFTYLLNGKANKALKLEPKFAESVVAYYIGIDNMAKINEIDVKNDVIDFEKAALNKKFDKVVSLKDKVSMDGRREKLIVEAYVNLKKFDDCFTFAKQQGNKQIMKDVKELQKQDILQSSMSEDEKKTKIEKIDSEIKGL